MGFFKLSDGNNAAQNNNGSFESGGGNFEPIPKGTSVLAVCEEAKIDEYEGDRFIAIKWSVAKPEEYKNRKVFQKIRCFDPNSEKRDKALRMLAAIDANAGGKLAAIDDEPTSQQLMQALANRPMVLKLEVWEINDKSGNWVAAVSKYDGKAAPAPVAKPAEPEFDPEADLPF